MTDQAVLTINQKVDAVNNFINAVIDDKNAYYCIVGKPDPWVDPETGIVDETKVLPANGSIAQIEQSVYQNMIYGKKIFDTDISFMIKRYQWASGTTYARYDHNDPDLYTKNFFVITDAKEVYKCIYNGYTPSFPNGVPSTVKPAIADTSSTFQTADGYIWKYMFTCETAAYAKFQTSSYIPVTPNTEVTDNAVAGTIDNIVLMNAGQGYEIFEEGFLRAFVNTSTVTLPLTSAPTDDYYKHSSIYLKAGFGAGQSRVINFYDGDSKNITVDPPFSYYQNLNLDHKRIYGGPLFTIGDIVDQLVSKLVYVYKTGSFNLGDTIYQSGTEAFGEILHANSVAYLVQNESSLDKTFLLEYPIYSTKDAPIQKKGRVSVVREEYVDVVKNGSVSVTAYPSDGVTGVNAAADTIKITNANKIFSVGDKLYYRVPRGNTAIGGLTGNSSYYVSWTNATDMAVSTVSPTFGGVNVNLTEARSSNPETHIFVSNVDFTTQYSLNTYLKVDEDNTSTGFRAPIRRITEIYPPTVTEYDLNITNLAGSFTVGDAVTQNGNTGTIIFANSTLLSVQIDSGKTFVVSPTNKIIKTSCTSINAVVTSSKAVYHDSYMVVNPPYLEDITNANNYLIPSAASVESVLSHYTKAHIIYTNLTSLELEYEDITPLGASYIIGEGVTVVDSNDISQNANGTISFANSTFMIVNNIQNPAGFVDGFYMIGGATNTRARISKVISNPNITVEVDYGGFTIPPSDPVPYKFLEGTKMFVSRQNGVPVGNAYIVSSYTSPDDSTEYIISPTVVISGDGNGAIAYCTVDLTNKNPTRSITSVTMINHGQNYTKANVHIISGWGYNADNLAPTGGGHLNDSAIAIPQLSPIHGHGYSAYTELGATYCGINKTFNNASQESFQLPTYGSYRNIGIIKNPLFNDVVFDTSNFDRTTLSITQPDITEMHFNGSSVLPNSTIYANTLGVNSSANTIKVPSASTLFKVGDRIYYSVPNNNTAIGGLTGNTSYYVSFTNVTDIALSLTINGANIDLTEARTATTPEQHKLTSNNNIIKITNNPFNIGDRILYKSLIGSAISPLANNSHYFISFANSSAVALSNFIPNTGPTVFPNTYNINVDSDSINIPNADQLFNIGDLVYYNVPTNNTAIGGLTANTYYYISFTNTSAIAVSSTISLVNVTLTELRTTTQPEIHKFVKNNQNPVYANISFTTVGSNDLGHSLRYDPGVFNVGEIVVQPFTSSAGVVVSANSTVVELKNSTGSFVYSSINDNIYGLSTGYVANVYYANTKYFFLPAALESVSDISRGGSGKLNQYLTPQGDTQQIRMTDVLGKFAGGDQIYEAVTNTYATIDSIYIANGTVDVTNSFGNKVNQTVRISFDQNGNNKPYALYEYVVQDVSWATGRVISTCDELDIEYTGDTTWSVGETIKSMATNATAVIKYHDPVNKTMKLTNVSKLSPFNETTNRPFLEQHIIKNASETKTATINTVYSVIILDDVNYISGLQTTPFLGVFTISPDKLITGQTSGAVGIASRENSIRLPDFVRESGEVIYTRNLEKFDKSLTSTEQIKLIIKF
jgi:hypothetical protein